MYGATELTAVLGATPRQGADPATWISYGRALVDIGLPVLFIQPGTKLPADLRSEREKDGPAGVHLATTSRATIKKYVERALKDPADKITKGHPAPYGPDAHLNWAVRLAGSGYVVADADTPGEVAALKAFLAPAYGGEHKVPGPTVLTPGTADGAHSGGGHWWFKLPESKDIEPDILPATISVRPDGHPEAFSLYSGNAYVLIPPSQRPEGHYHLVGSDNVAPLMVMEQLKAATTTATELRAERVERQRKADAGELGDMETQVATWSQATPWVEVLEPHGWTNTGMVDKCGCDIWTAPGAHSSPKSATTHMDGCSQAYVDPLNPPMHLWTDNPGAELEAVVKDSGSKTMSKLTAYSALAHDGSMSAALEAAGVSAGGGQLLDPADLTAGVSEDSPARVDTQATQSNIDNTIREVHAPVVVEPEPTEWEVPNIPVDPRVPVYTPDGRDMWAAWGLDGPDPEKLKWAPKMAALSAFDGMPTPGYIIDGLLEDRGLLSIVGDSGVGKSAVVLDMAGCIVTGRPWHGREVRKQNVLYIAGEGVAGAKTRLDEWIATHDDADSLRDNLYIMPEPQLFGASVDHWAALAYRVRQLDIGLVIFDTLARMSSGLDENSATDMNKALQTWDRLRRTAKVTVLYVHHTTRGTNHARGSTALKGAVDSELLVLDTREDGRPFATNESNQAVDANGNPLPGKPLTVKVSKQKNASDDVFEHVCLVPSGDSMIVTDLEGQVEAPEFTDGSGVTLGAPTGDTPAETAQRVVDAVSSYDSLVPSMTDLARAVEWPESFTGSAKEWRAHLHLAVDYAVSHRMIYQVKGGFTLEPDLDN